MSQDIHVRFLAQPSLLGPSAEQITFVIEDYFGSAMTSLGRNNGACVVALGSRSTRPAIARTLPKEIEAYYYTLNEADRDFKWDGTRLMEVIYTPGNELLTIRLRHVDEFTRDVARGFATILTRRWGGSCRSAARSGGAPFST